MGWKIVRDRQKEFCQERGISGSWRIAEHPVNALTKKLFEEASEFAEHYDPGELFDLRDVLEELIFLTDYAGIYERKHAEKVSRMGLFSLHREWSPDPKLE